MVVFDAVVVSDPARLMAVQRGRRTLPTLPMPLDAIARLAAGLLGAPTGVITLIGEQRQHLAGSFGVPPSLATGGETSLAYSVCKYVVSADAPVSCADMSVEDDPQLRGHPLNTEYAVRAFLGVPLRDADDRPLGSLTVLHMNACEWTGAQLSTLLEVAELIGPVPNTGPVLDATALAALDPAVVLDTMAEAFIALDPDANVTGWNRAAQHMFGHTPQQAAGHPVGDLLKAEFDGDPVEQVITRLLTGVGAGPLSGPVRWRHSSGRAVYADVRFAVVHGPAGTAACAFLTDTTRHITAAIDAADALAGDLAEALAEADANAQVQRGFITALLDSLREGVVAVDRAGSPVVFNHALRELCGVPAACSPSEALDVALGQLHQLDDTVMDLDHTAMARAMHGQIVRDADSVLITPGRPDRYLQSNAQPIRDSDGRQIGAVSTVRDTTERRRTARFRACELAVATILNRADSITAAAPVVLSALARALDWPYAALWLTDQVGDRVDLIGEYTAPGYHLAGLLPGRIPRGAAGVIGQVWDTGRSCWLPEVTESGLLRGPPLQAFVQACHEQDLSCLSAVPVRDGGAIVGVLSCVAATAETDEFLINGLLDTTAAQFGHFLNRSRTAELAARLDRARADFADSVGHDMRTPLTAIGTCVDLLLAAPHAQPGDVHLLRTVERNSARLSGLIDSLLQFAALHAENVSVDVGDVDLTALVTEACETVRPSADAAGLAMELHLDDGVLVAGEPALLQHLLDLLLAGAVESHPGDGPLLVALASLRGGAQLTLSGPIAAGTERALARAIVEGHHGAITFTGITDGVVDIRLPRGEPAP